MRKLIRNCEFKRETFSGAKNAKIYLKGKLLIEEKTCKDTFISLIKHLTDLYNDAPRSLSGDTKIIVSKDDRHASKVNYVDLGNSGYKLNVKVGWCETLNFIKKFIDILYMNCYIPTNDYELQITLKNKK